MKYVKMLGLLAMAAAALMAFAGTASATEVTSEGKTYTGVIEAEAGETTLHGAVTITCQKSTMNGEVKSHGSEVTATGPITSLTFTECNQHVTVLEAGELTVHTDHNDPAGTSGNGTLTSNGARVTIQITSLGISCIFGSSTEEVHVGTLTGSKTTGGHAVLHIDSEIPRVGHSIFCGSSGRWTGTYTVIKPSRLDVI